MSYGYESRKWYHFATARYLRRTHGLKDRLFIDAALGIRPWLTEYREMDVVFLLENNYEAEAAGDGQRILWTGPTALISPHPHWMFKAGVQLPVYQKHHATRYRSTLGGEIQFYF